MQQSLFPLQGRGEVAGADRRRNNYFTKFRMSKSNTDASECLKTKKESGGVCTATVLTEGTAESITHPPASSSSPAERSWLLLHHLLLRRPTLE